jgi:predicted O-methyltransferase YrrM
MKTKILKLTILFFLILYTLLTIYSIHKFNLLLFIIAIQFLTISFIGFLYITHKNALGETKQLICSRSQKICDEININYRQNEALINLISTLNPRIPFPVMRGWAASPDFLRELVVNLVESKPKFILETGSGVSTLVIAYAIEKFSLNSRLISLENNNTYLEKNLKLLALHGLCKYVDLIYAPLVESESSPQNLIWYNLSNKIIPQEIDMLVVDGPPASDNPFARYPAVPLLWRHLNSGCKIFMDDYERSGEKLVVEKWLKEYKLRINSEAYYDKGFAIIEKI